MGLEREGLGTVISRGPPAPALGHNGSIGKRAALRAGKLHIPAGSLTSGARA